MLRKKKKYDLPRVVNFVNPVIGLPANFFETLLTHLLVMLLTEILIGIAVVMAVWCSLFAMLTRSFWHTNIT